jgi:hypothetical protein
MAAPVNAELIIQPTLALDVRFLDVTNIPNGPKGLQYTPSIALLYLFILSRSPPASIRLFTNTLSYTISTHLPPSYTSPHPLPPNPSLKNE